MTTYSNHWTKFDIYENILAALLMVRLEKRPACATNRPNRFLDHRFSFRTIQLPNAPPLCRKERREKDFVMPFDKDKYRAYLAPFDLPKPKEDELLCDLWKVSSLTVDVAIQAHLYPQPIKLEARSFDAPKEAIAVESEESEPTTDEKETP